MARPLPTSKQSVDLASSGVRVSRIRRDPPPKVKEKDVDAEDREQWEVLIGVVVVALAIFVIIFAFGNQSIRVPGEYTIEVNASE